MGEVLPGNGQPIQITVVSKPDGMHGPARPELSELERLRLERAWLQLENAQLKITVVQGHAEAARRAIEALIEAGQREGYQLQRLDTGAWVYTPIEGVGR